MSLLIFGSANRIGQGVLSRLLRQNLFQKIICADLYPTYSSIKRFLPLKSEIKANYPNLHFEDIKIQDRSDLARAVSKSSHFVYITHDYYSAVPSKLNLVTLSAELSKQYKLKKFIALAPVEHDHFNEENPNQAALNSLKRAFELNSESIILNSDITFGAHSTFCHTLISKIVNGDPICFLPNYTKELGPIHVDDVSNVVGSLLSNNTSGKTYTLKGNDKVTIGDIFSVLQKYVGDHAQLNQSLLHKIVPPTHLNFATEQLYSSEDINLFSMIKKYSPPSEFETYKDFNGDLKVFKESYPEQGIRKTEYKDYDDFVEKKIKSILD